MRNFSLADDTSPDQVSAEFKYGVLSVQLMKNAKAKPRYTEVKVA